MVEDTLGTGVPSKKHTFWSELTEMTTVFLKLRASPNPLHPPVEAGGAVAQRQQSWQSGLCRRRIRHQLN
eukprot:3375381-Alexandrium_andersonii.AAC.1